MTLALGLLPALNASAGAYDHLKEAIVLNRTRMPLYSKLSHGETEALSRRMIRIEKLSLALGKTMDLMAKPFQEQGLSIGEVEFIPMANRPEFAEHYEFTPEPLSSFEATDAKKLRRKLRRAMNENGFAGLSSVATEELEKLKTPRAYHCMTRHILESIIRAANLAPIHAREAKEVGAKSTQSLSWLLTRSQFLLLGFAAKMDEDLAPIQAKNIPMLCQDVPYIPAY